MGRDPVRIQSDELSLRTFKCMGITGGKDRAPGRGKQREVLRRR